MHYITLIVISTDSENGILPEKIENDMYNSNNPSSITLKKFSEKHKFYRMTFDTAIICSKKKKIKSLAIKLENVISHLNYIYSGIKNMKSEYERKIKTVNDNIKKFVEIMEDFAGKFKSFLSINKYIMNYIFIYYLYCNCF